MMMKRERGKIPKSEWPAIAGRHLAGESMASIARSYGCTAPAIRYIVRREGGVLADDGFQTEPTVVSSLGSELDALSGGDARHRRDDSINGSRTADKNTVSDSAPLRGDVLDSTLHDRVTRDIAAFLAAFDMALSHPTDAHFEMVRDAADLLMRSAARTRIEVERYLARHRRGDHE